MRPLAATVLLDRCEVLLGVWRANHTRTELNYDHRVAGFSFRTLVERTPLRNTVIQKALGLVIEANSDAYTSGAVPRLF